MLGRLGQPNRLGGMLDDLGESAGRDEAQTEPTSIVDRWRCGGSEIVVDPVGRYGGEVTGGQLDHSLVLTSKVVRLLEVRRRQDAQSQVAETSGDVQGPGARHHRLVQLSEQRMK